MIGKIECYCSTPELVENYDKAIADKTQTWCIHHRLEISPTGKVFSRRRLIELGLYYDRPANEFIFLTKSEHMKLHNKYRVFSDETKKKMSKSMIGNKSCVGRKLSEKTKYKLSLAAKNTMSKRVRGADGKFYAQGIELP